MPKLRILFFGTAEIAGPSLRALLANPDFSVVAAVTQPDRPKGRDLNLQPSAVKQVAVAAGLPVLQPPKARDLEFLEAIRKLSPDLIVVVAYGQILSQTLLDIPRVGCVNVHTSILPRHRGAAPIQWAILSGDTVTGVTIMKMDAGMDTGGILALDTTPILPTDNAQTVHDRLATLGAALLVRVIPEFAAGRIVPQPQSAEGATYARKITKEDGLIDWTQSAIGLWNRIRAFVPWPGAYTLLPAIPKPKLLKIWEAEPVNDKTGIAGMILSADKHGLVVACGEGALRILRLQPEGGRIMSAPEFLAGHPLRAGDSLGASIA